MQTFDSEVVVEALAAARRRAHAVELDPDWRGVDLDAAYAMQHAVAARLGQVRGWKISALTAAQQEAAGLAAPIAAPLLEPWFVSSEAVFSRLAFCKKPLLECEFAFAMGADLPPRSTAYSRAEVVAAIASMHLVLEVCDSRLAAPGSTLQQLVDCFNNGAFVLGPACAGWRELDYANAAVVLRAAADGRVLASGSGAAVLDGDPIGAVVAMANLQPARPGGLRAGQVVTTGSCTTPFAVATDAEFIGDFGDLGSVRVRFGDSAAVSRYKEQRQ